MTGGKERTAKRFELPLVAADLQFLRVIPTDLPTIIIEAEPHSPAPEILENRVPEVLKLERYLARPPRIPAPSALN